MPFLFVSKVGGDGNKISVYMQIRVAKTKILTTQPTQILHMQTDFIDLRGICQFCLSRIYTRQHAIFYKGDILKLRPLNFANYWRPLIVCFKGRYGINREGSPVCLTNQICIPQVSVSPTPWTSLVGGGIMGLSNVNPRFIFFLFCDLLWQMLTFSVLRPT